MTLRICYAFLVLLAFGFAGRVDYEEAKRVEMLEQQRQWRCIRTYIPRPRGDAIRCNECRFILADGSSIKKEGC